MASWGEAPAVMRRLVAFFAIVLSSLVAFTWSVPAKASQVGGWAAPLLTPSPLGARLTGMAAPDQTAPVTSATVARQLGDRLTLVARASVRRPVAEFYGGSCSPRSPNAVCGTTRESSTEALNTYVFGYDPRSASTTPRQFVATKTPTGPGKPSLPFKDPKLAAQVDDVVAHFDEFGTPPPGVAQGGMKGQPVGTWGNKAGDLPTKPLGYYTESDVWTSQGVGSGTRGAERLVLGKNGEVYYTADHYKAGSWVRIR